jgi:hypothetical protein
LNDRLAKLWARTPAVMADHLADATVYAKGVAWALRYHEALTPADMALLKKALERGNERAAALEAGKRPWADKRGKVVRAFVSAVDGSVQPCGVIVPARYDPAKPIRLDVVLHGSSRPAGMSELRFLGRFDEGDADGGGAHEQDYIELHPLGRVENCYRWAGETDVFEAIEAACRTRRRRSTCSTPSTTPPTPASCRRSPAWARRTSSSGPTSSWAGRCGARG